MDVSNRKRSLREENTASPEKKPRLAMYLEDYTPVRTIEVNNVPTDLREDLCLSYLLGFFERDGPVEHVEIVKKTENEWLAYVTFVVPDDAARLICNKNVPGYCRSSKFTIKEAEHEHQPKLDPNVLNLEGVNDHCLLKIMSHLQLIDIINLGKTSTRMQSVTQMFYEKYAHFSFGSITGDSSINETNLPVILEVLGSYIRSIDWHHLNASQFECLAKYCPNVTKIKMSFVKKDLSTAILNRHKQFFANLKQLSIESAPYLYDGNLKSMMSGNKLITLDMNRCLKLRGKFINTRNRAKLRNIRIVDCTGMDDATCFSIAEWKNKLITFTFNKCCSYLHYLSLPPESMGELKELQLDFTCFKGDVEGLNFSGLTKLKKTYAYTK